MAESTIHQRQRSSPVEDKGHLQGRINYYASYAMACPPPVQGEPVAARFFLNI